MKTIKYFLFTVFALTLFTACGDDSADDPTFGDQDIPMIFGDWPTSVSIKEGESLIINTQVSPSNNAVFKWYNKTTGDLISTADTLLYVIGSDVPEEWILRFEVERNGVVNHRETPVAVEKELVPKTGYNKKTVAFLSKMGTMEDIQWDNITHLILSSSKINESGAIDTDFLSGSKINYKDLLVKAHNKGVYVLLQYTGDIDYTNSGYTWSSKKFYNAATNAASRTQLVKTMIQHALDKGFDGIDIRMDKAIGAGNTDFTDQQGLKEFYKLVADNVPEKSNNNNQDFLLTMSMYTGGEKNALEAVANTPGYDWVNIFALNVTDLAPLQHASTYRATGDCEYWTTNAGVPANKIILVVPAYGVHYNADLTGITWSNWATYATYVNYRDICEKYPNAWDKSMISDEGTLYYNGFDIIDQKTALVTSNGYGGMGLWAAEGDSNDPAQSLLKRMFDKLGN